MAKKKLTSAEAQMCIRKPANEVFQAFIDPALTKYFWFTKGNDRLEVNKTIIWEWEMYNFSTKVVATQIIADKKIVIEWFTAEKPTIVDFDFKELSNGSTFVTIRHSGFQQKGIELQAAINDSTSGFTIVLAGLKAFLEHNINLNLILDKFPKEIAEHGL
jgi:uncharacterized protein YndB with AHSA1/START domain